MILPGNGHNLYAHLHVEDCGRLLAAIAEQGWTGVSPVADDHAASWREFVDTIREHFPRVRVYWAPSWLSRAAPSPATASGSEASRLAAASSKER